MRLVVGIAILGVSLHAEDLKQQSNIKGKQILKKLTFSRVHHAGTPHKFNIAPLKKICLDDDFPFQTRSLDFHGRFSNFGAKILDFHA